MDINSRVEVEATAPFYIRIFVWIFEIFPLPNTIKGIIAYSSAAYAIFILLRIISALLLKYNEGRADKDKEELNKKIIEKRRIRSIEANNLLDKINKSY